MPTIRISSSAGAYDVHCAFGSLRRAGSLLSRLKDVTGVDTPASSRVGSYWGRGGMPALPRHKPLKIILFDDSESSKDLQTIEALTRQLVLAGADRRAAIISVELGR